MSAAVPPSSMMASGSSAGDLKSEPLTPTAMRAADASESVASLLGRTDGISREKLLTPAASQSNASNNWSCPPNCSPRCKQVLLHFTTACFVASILAFSILLGEKPGIKTATWYSLGLGASVQAGMRSGIEVETFEKVNRFVMDWGFEIFFGATQFDENRDLFPNPDVVKRIVYALMGVQAGNAVLSDILVWLKRYEVFGGSERGYRPHQAIQYLDNSAIQINTINERRERFYPKKMRMIWQIAKNALAILAIILDKTVWKEKDTFNVATDIGVGVLAHSAGNWFSGKLITWRDAERDRLATGVNLSSPQVGAPRRSKCDCLGVLEAMANLGVFAKEVVAGVAIQLTRYFQVPTFVGMGVLGVVSGSSEQVLLHQFEKFEFTWERDENDDMSLIELETCWQRTRRKVENFFSRQNLGQVIAKGALTTGLYSWFIYGITDVNDSAKLGIGLFLTSLIIGYIVTKAVDNQFTPAEEHPLIRSLYFYLIKHPDYLLYLFIYLRHLNTNMGRSAYLTTNYNATLADLAWVSVGLAAGNNRARGDSSLGKKDYMIPLLRAVLAGVILDFFVNKLS